MKKSRIVLVLCMMVVIAVASVAGTIAWLTDTTTPVTNTFTTAGIDIELIETKKSDGTEVAAGVTDWSAKLVPGVTYPKNPVVTVKANSEVCYLFVEFTETNAPATYLAYTYMWDAEGQTEWTKLNDNVWYRTVAASGADQSWNLLVNNQVTVKKDLVKGNMPTANPTISFKAYAIQTAETGTAAEAWAKISH